MHLVSSYERLAARLTGRAPLLWLLVVAGSALLAVAITLAPSTIAPSTRLAIALGGAAIAYAGFYLLGVRAWFASPEAERGTAVRRAGRLALALFASLWAAMAMVVLGIIALTFMPRF